MNMRDWAAREVEIASKRERNNAPEVEWDYGCACYDSALKAFNSLIEDGRSGMSIGFTKNILIRLIDGKPLTPIEDTEDIWKNGRTEINSEYTTYQCNRMSSLFKYVYSDGTVTYNDVNRSYCVDIIKQDTSYNNGFVSNIIDKLWPITMPYIPETNKIKVVCEDFLINKANGDFDTLGILYCIKADGKKYNINRYFKGEDDWVEINYDEYEMRRLLSMRSRI